MPAHELDIPASTAPITFDEFLAHKGYLKPKAIATHRMAALMAEYQQAGHATAAMAVACKADCVMNAKELAETAATHCVEAEENARAAIRSAIAAGLSLMALRQHSGRGALGKYMQEAGIAERTGQRYMKLVTALALSHGLPDDWKDNVKARQVSPMLVEEAADSLMQRLSPNMQNLTDLLASTSSGAQPGGAGASSTTTASEIDQLRRAVSETWESLDRHFELIFDSAKYQLLPDESLEAMEAKCRQAAQEAQTELARRHPERGTGAVLEIAATRVTSETPATIPATKR